MKRSHKAFRAIVLVFAILLGLLAIAASANAGLCAVEARRYPAPGKLVEVDGGRMHVYGEGAGPHTVVLLSGWGSPCPTYDFMPLIRALRGEYRVVVVDYFGYGWSDGTRRPRTSDNIVEETRAALRKAGVPPPYVLAPHSLSAVYALYYANAHPGEIEAVLDLDGSLPDQVNYQGPTKGINVNGILRATGLIRPLIHLMPSLVGYNTPYYTDAERERLYAMICRTYSNATATAESDSGYGNRRQLLGMKFPAAIPVATVVADGMIAPIAKAFPGMDWLALHRKQLEGNAFGKVYLLQGDHNIYRSQAARISEILGELLAPEAPRKR